MVVSMVDMKDVAREKTKAGNWGFSMDMKTVDMTGYPMGCLMVEQKEHK